jgi:hypothetical protein
MEIHGTKMGVDLQTRPNICRVTDATENDRETKRRMTRRKKLCLADRGINK